MQNPLFGLDGILFCRSSSLSLSLLLKAVKSVLQVD